MLNVNHLENMEWKTFYLFIFFVYFFGRMKLSTLVENMAKIFLRGIQSLLLSLLNVTQMQNMDERIFFFFLMYSFGRKKLLGLMEKDVSVFWQRIIIGW